MSWFTDTQLNRMEDVMRKEEPDYLAEAFQMVDDEETIPVSYNHVFALVQYIREKGL
jgi:Ca2+-binding EF-hand superfamily protein